MQPEQMWSDRQAIAVTKKNKKKTKTQATTNAVPANDKADG